MQQQTGQDRVQTDRFTGAGGTGDQQMGHAGQIRPESGAVNILAQRDAQLPFMSPEIITFDHFPQADGRTGLVLHLDPYVGLARDRRFNGQLLDGKLHFQVLLQHFDLFDADSGLPPAPFNESGFHTELGECRTALDIHHGTGCPEGIQQAFNFFCLCLDRRIIRRGPLILFDGIQDLLRIRQDPGVFRRLCDLSGSFLLFRRNGGNKGIIDPGRLNLFFFFVNCDRPRAYLYSLFRLFLFHRLHRFRRSGKQTASVMILLFLKDRFRRHFFLFREQFRSCRSQRQLPGLLR